MKGYCSPVTQAAVWYIPSCWPLSEQCQVKFLSWSVLRSHSISNTNSTTVTLLWWAAGTQKKDLGSISECCGHLSLDGYGFRIVLINIYSVLKLFSNAKLTLHKRKFDAESIRSASWNCHVSNTDTNSWVEANAKCFKYKLLNMRHKSICVTKRRFVLRITPLALPFTKLLLRHSRIMFLSKICEFVFDHGTITDSHTVHTLPLSPW